MFSSSSRQWIVPGFVLHCETGNEKLVCPAQNGQVPVGKTVLKSPAYKTQPRHPKSDLPFSGYGGVMPLRDIAPTSSSLVLTWAARKPNARAAST
jgi:hypothetical protein